MVRKLKNRQSKYLVIEVRIWLLLRLLTKKGHKGDFWGAGNVLYIDLYGGYADIYIYEHYWIVH